MALLTRFGIGAATLDLIPHRTTVRPGDAIEAHLEVTGGSSTQTVEDVDIALITRYQTGPENDRSSTNHVLWETEVTDGFAIEAETDRTIDVPPIQVPWSTPATLGEVEVWIQSGLDIDWALDPSDEDQLTVEPGPRLQAVLDAMDHLGFGLRTTRNEEAETQFAPHPFVQRFDFRGGAEPFAGKLDAVHLTPIPSRPDEDLLVLMTVDRIGEREIGDKRRGRFTVSTDDVDAIADRLHDKIESRL